MTGVRSQSRAETLLRDRHRTRAICAYVKHFREGLLQELPQRVDKANMRNELLRLGRQRFLQEPAMVQHRFMLQSGGRVVVGAGTEGATPAKRVLTQGAMILAKRTTNMKKQGAKEEKIKEEEDEEEEKDTGNNELKPQRDKHGKRTTRATRTKCNLSQEPSILLATPKHKHPADPADMTTNEVPGTRCTLSQRTSIEPLTNHTSGPKYRHPADSTTREVPRCRLNRKTSTDALKVITTKKRRLAKKTEHIGESQERCENCEEDLGPQGLANKDDTGMNDQVGAQSADDAVMAATALATSCEAGASEVQHIIAKQVPVLWKLFGAAEGAAILSSALRLLSCCDGACRGVPIWCCCCCCFGFGRQAFPY